MVKHVSIKEIDIQFNEHDVFLELPSEDILLVNRLETRQCKCIWEQVNQKAYVEYV